MESLKTSLKNIRLNSHQFTIEKHSVFKISGSDTLNFLSNQITTDCKKIANKSFHESAIVDIKGRLVCSFLLIRESDNLFYISFDQKYEDLILERFNLYLISEDVEFEKESKVISIALNHKCNKSFLGKLFGLNSSLSFSAFDLPKATIDDLQRIRFVSGKSLMGIHVLPGELITNTYLANYCIDFNKGCYPGQETISKITNNKGASQFPMALIGDLEIAEDIIVDGKKIGKVKEIIKIDKKYFHYVTLNRENRIEDKSLRIENTDFTVKAFPLIDNGIESLSNDLFDEAVYQFQNDNNEEAKRLLNQLISLNPAFSDAYESLGVILGREGHFKEAIDVMKKLTEVDPTSVMAHTNLSMYYMQLGDKDTAEEYKANATIKQFEKFGIEADIKRKKEEEKEQKRLEKEQRESMFHQVLEIDEDDALANFGLGELELERENFDKAIAHLEKAINTDPKYSVAYLVLGKALYFNKKLPDSKSIFELGVEIASKQGDLMPANEMQSYLNKL